MAVQLQTAIITRADMRLLPQDDDRPVRMRHTRGSVMKSAKEKNHVPYGNLFTVTTMSLRSTLRIRGFSLDPSALFRNQNDVRCSIPKQDVFYPFHSSFCFAREDEKEKQDLDRHCRTGTSDGTSSIRGLGRSMKKAKQNFQLPEFDMAILLSRHVPWCKNPCTPSSNWWGFPLAFQSTSRRPVHSANAHSW